MPPLKGASMASGRPLTANITLKVINIAMQYALLGSYNQLKLITKGRKLSRPW